MGYRQPAAHSTRVYGWAIGALVVAVLYVLSYAPAYRVMRDTTGDLLPWGEPWFVYKPVDYLIDESLLDRPLLAWSYLWGVRDQFEWAAMQRGGLTTDEDGELILYNDGYDDEIEEIRAELDAHRAGEL